jgi:exodeoxyribonuclease-3
VAEGFSVPDIVCLQEIKTVDEGFPRLEIEALGYHVETHGQKGFNGVAILSKMKPDEVNARPAGRSDGRAVAFHRRRSFRARQRRGRVACLYLPNGNPIDDREIPLQACLDGTAAHACGRTAGNEEPLILAGDYNVIPEPHDCFDPKVWETDALFLPQTRRLSAGSKTSA